MTIIGAGGVFIGILVIGGIALAIAAAVALMRMK
jgi:hypothetical protein